MSTSNTKRNLRIGPLRNSGLLSAGLRALESSSPSTATTPLITDPHAEGFAGEVGVRLARRTEEEFPDLRPALLSRQRFIDEWVTARIREGSRTLFSLAAGVECRIARLPLVEEMRAKVVDIDSKPMLLLKLHRLHRLFGKTPPWICLMESRAVHRLPLKMIQRLPGLRTRPAVFVLEGLLNVFEPEQVETLLQDLGKVRVARRALVFDYFDDSEEARNIDRSGFAKAFAGGTPRFFMKPARIRRALERLGYKKIHDRTLAEITGYYGCDREDLKPIRVVTAEAVSGS